VCTHKTSSARHSRCSNSVVAVLASASDSHGDLGRGGLSSEADATRQGEPRGANLLRSEGLEAVQAVVETDAAESLFGLREGRDAGLSVLLSAGGALILEGGVSGGEAGFNWATVRAALSGREVVLDHAAVSSVSEPSGAGFLSDVSRGFLALASLLDDVNLSVSHWGGHATSHTSHTTFLAKKSTKSESTFSTLKRSAVISGGSPASTLSVLLESSGAELLGVVRGNVHSRALRSLSAANLANLDQRELLGHLAATIALNESSGAESGSGLLELLNALLALLDGTGGASSGLGGLDDALKALKDTLVADDLRSGRDSLLTCLAVQAEASGA